MKAESNHQTSEKEKFDKIISEAKIESDLLGQEIVELSKAVKGFIKRNNEVKNE